MFDISIFESGMERIKEIISYAEAYVRLIRPELWANYHFPA